MTAIIGRFQGFLNKSSQPGHIANRNCPNFPSSSTASTTIMQQKLEKIQNE